MRRQRRHSCRSTRTHSRIPIPCKRQAPNKLLPDIMEAAAAAWQRNKQPPPLQTLKVHPTLRQRRRRHHPTKSWPTNSNSINSSNYFSFNSNSSRYVFFRFVLYAANLSATNYINNECGIYGKINIYYGGGGGGNKRSRL